MATTKAEELGGADTHPRGSHGGVEGAMDEVLGQEVAGLALFFMGSFKRLAPGAGRRGIRS